MTDINKSPRQEAIGGQEVGLGPDPMDLESAVVNQDYLRTAAADQIARPPRVRKPRKGEFFQTFPHRQIFNLYTDVVDGKIDKDFYIIMPSMAAAFQSVRSAEPALERRSLFRS